MPNFTFGNGFVNAIATPAAPLTGTWYAQLMTPEFVFDPDTMDTRASITSGEVTPVGSYTAGGKPITVTITTAGTIVTVTWAEVQWIGANITNAGGMLIYYRPSGSIPSEQWVMGFNNFGAAQNHFGGIFRIESGYFEVAKVGSAAHTIPTATITAILNEQLPLSTTTVYAMLLGTGYTPNVAHSSRSNLTSEISATGYPAGGVVCPVTVARDDTTNRTTVTFNGPIFPAATYSAQYVAFYERLGGAASADRVILIMNFGAAYSSGGNVFPVGNNTITIAPSYPS